MVPAQKCAGAFLLFEGMEMAENFGLKACSFSVARLVVDDGRVFGKVLY